MQAKFVILTILITILILGGGVWFLGNQDTQEQIKLSEPLMGEEIPIQGLNHIPEGEKATYNSDPPTSGPHYANSQPAGVYEKTVPDGNLIHSMEHGAVILWYKSDMEATDSARLKSIFESTPVGKKIMVPRDSLDMPVALTSWGRLLKLKAIDEDQIRKFLQTNENRGPEKAPL